MRKLLLVDDEKFIRLGTRTMIERSGTSFKEIHECSNGSEAIKKISEEIFDLVIHDIRMPAMDGISFMKEAQRLKNIPKFVILSGYEDFQYASQAIKYGAKAYLLKPVQRDEMKDVLLKVENELLKEETFNKANEIFNKFGYDELKGILSSDDLQVKTPEEFTLRESYKEKNELLEAVRYISENYHRDISMTMVANHVSLTYSYFSYLFKEHTGLTFVEYLRKVRIDKPLEMLKNTDIRIAEVGERAGFPNSKHFSKTFKAVTGISPAEYREKAHSN